MRQAEQGLLLAMICLAVRDGDIDWLTSPACTAVARCVGLSELDTLALQCGAAWGLLDAQRFWESAMKGERWHDDHGRAPVFWGSWSPVARSVGAGSH